MVMQWTVNPPSSGTTGSIPVFSTKFSHSSPRGGQRIVYPYQVGSSPIYGARFALVSLVVEVLPCKQGVEVRFLPGAPNWGQQRAAELPCKHLV